MTPLYLTTFRVNVTGHEFGGTRARDWKGTLRWIAFARRKGLARAVRVEEACPACGASMQSPGHRRLYAAVYGIGTVYICPHAYTGWEILAP